MSRLTKATKPAFLLAVLGMIALTSTGFSQAAASGRPAQQSDLRDLEVVQLTPFVVTSSQDRGYAAANTLAGTRLNTSLADTSAAISVFNQAFLIDTGALSTVSAMGYAANADNEFTDLTGSTHQYNQANLQIRGFTAITLTRDYFPWALEGDIYNTDRIDFSRGPNSILFGIGSPGGVVNTTIKRPQFGKPINEFRFRVGSWHDYRGTIDVGRQIGKAFAMRLNAVDQKQKSWRDFEFVDRKAADLALAYRPFQNTEIRLDGEYGNVHQVRIAPFPAGDAVSQWIAAGSPIASNNGAAVKGGTSSAALAVAGTLPWNNFQIIYDPYSITGPVPWRGTLVTKSAPTIASNALLATPVSESIVPRSRNLYGPGAKVNFKYHNYSAFIDQKIGHLSAQLAFNRQYESRQIFTPMTYNTANLQADPNALLPSWALPNGQLAPNAGAPNPNVGKLYVQSVGSRTAIKRDSNNYRLTLSYDLDLTNRREWLGKYQLAGMLSRAENYAYSDIGQEANITPAGTATYPTDITAGVNQIFRRSYLSFDSTDRTLWAMSDPSRFPINNINGVTSAFVRRANWSNPSQTNIDTWMVAGQGKWWHDRLVGTAGLRYDSEEVFNAGAAAPRDSVTREFLVRGLDYSAPALADNGYTRTYGGVFHAFPWVSIFYNHANTFQPQSLFDVNNDPIHATSGRGQDVGVRFSLFHRKVELSVDRYRTIQGDQAFPNSNKTALIASINNIWSALGKQEKLVNNASLDTADKAGHGYEVEMSMNPSERFRLSANFSETYVSTTNIYPRFGAYIEANRAEWQQNASAPLVGTVQILNPPPNPTVGDAITSVDTVYRTIRLADGNIPLQTVKHSASVFGTYTFAQRAGWIHSLMVGGGFIYRGPAVVGYDSSRAPLLGNGYVIWNLVAGRTFQLGSKFRLRVQVNVDNLLNNTDNIVLDRNTLGEVDFWRYQTPRRWSITNTLTF